MPPTRPIRFAAIAILAAGLSLPAHAVNKDMIQLQTQVQALQDAVARLQQSNDENIGMLKSLIQQTADSVNKMTIAVNGMQLRMQNQQDASSTKNDQLSGQIQGLNDSVDELKARLGRIEKQITDVQSQQQSANAILSALPQGGAPPAGGTAPANPPQGATSVPPPSNPQSTTSSTTTPAGPSAGDLYRTAYGDYMTGKYPLATSEFNALIQAYPDDNLSGNAWFYIGEIQSRANKPGTAVKAWNQVIEKYPDNSKIPAAQLHKGQALLSIQQKESGIRELRSLIQRYPNSPEAMQARTRLSALGVAKQ
ncbi:MAG: tetratricopeptide repeat protein [Acidobacteriota bacterium]